MNRAAIGPGVLTLYQRSRRHTVCMMAEECSDSDETDAAVEAPRPQAVPSRLAMLCLLMLTACALFSILPTRRLSEQSEAALREARADSVRFVTRATFDGPIADTAAAADALVTADRNGVGRELFAAVAGGLRGRYGALRAATLFMADTDARTLGSDALMFSETVPGFDNGGVRRYLPVRYRMAAGQGRPLLSASASAAAALPLYQALSRPNTTVLSSLYAEAGETGGGGGFWVMRAVTAPGGRVTAVLGLEIDAAALLRTKALPEHTALVLRNADDPDRGLSVGDPEARKVIDVFSLGAENGPLRVNVAINERIAAAQDGVLPALAAAAVTVLAAVLSVGLLTLERLRSVRFVPPVAVRDRKPEETQFRQLLENADMIPWAADLSDYSFTYVGPQIRAYVGYPPKAWYVPGFWLNHVHPDDRKRLTSAAAELGSGVDRVTREYRVRRADGTYLRMRGTFVRSDAELTESGLPRRLHGFMTDITEQQRAQELVNAARDSAEHANRTKSEFLATMSHELRTPLNAIIGFSEIMREEILGSLGNEKYREYVRNIHSSGRHLLELINDVLDLSKIEAGHLELHEEEVLLRDLIESCHTLVAERAQRSGIRIRTDVSTELMTLFADGRRLKQVLINLLSNAVKFTESGGTVTLSGQVQADGSLALAVIDSGVGMKPEQIATALEKFRQVDSGATRAHEGTGLGLPIARSLVELHGGTLKLESVYGKGTTVTVSLPASRLRRTAQHVA